MRFIVASVLVVCTLASGCAQLVVPNYSADFSAVDALKRAPLQKASVGTVQPVDPAAKVNRLSLRGAGLGTPDGTFSAYLGRAITADLKDAALYDAQSPRHIDLVLLQNEIDVSGFSEGKGQIEVDLSLVNGSTTLLRKTYAATTRFDSSFAGAVAIPKGQSEYPNVVRSLLSTIYRDPAFIKAMQTP